MSSLSLDKIKSKLSGFWGHAPKPGHSLPQWDLLKSDTQQSIYQLGQIALNEFELSHFLEKASTLVSETLQVECARIFATCLDTQALRLKGSVGVSVGAVGEFSLKIDIHSPEGLLMASCLAEAKKGVYPCAPLIIPDFHREIHFSGESVPAHLTRGSYLGVIVPGSVVGRPYGVLSVFSSKPQAFKPAHLQFLQAAANVIGSALIRCQLEEELKNRVLDLHVAHRQKDEFLATLSHELRSPLNVILGYLTLMKDMDPTSKEFTEGLEAIERNAHAESQLVSDTLEVSRIITGKMKLDIGVFPLSRVVHLAIESIAFVARAKNLTVTLEMDDSIGELEGDESRIRQVIWNLLSNAAKFTPPSGKIEVRVNRLKIEPIEQIEIEVQDSGQGIDPASLPFVFNRFWQEDAKISRTHTGLGLGLSIVRQIVELHGGQVGIFSLGRNQGTTLSVRLPVVLPPSSEAWGGQVMPRGPSAAFSLAQYESIDLQGKTILIIDDCMDSLDLLTKILKKNGASVCSKSSPEEGLEAAKATRYDILISDIGMPGLDGYELIKIYREWETAQGLNHVPAIALTAYAHESCSKKALQAGFHKHVTKPINFKILNQTIVNLISN